jgi:flagellar basal-body rod protein FlgF/flagellar basal-body rod protein FlgG
MDSGYYAAVAGVVARTQDLDIAASNLANAQTPGYRAEREVFRSVLLGTDAADSQLGQVVNNYGVLGGDQINLAQGTLERTGNPLDLAIEGDGFFAVQTAQGVRYTRNGSFHRTADGKLATASGDSVLSPSGQPIPVPPGEVTIGTDGSLSVDGGVGASVGVFAFPKGTDLKPEGADRYVAPEDAQAQAANDTVVHQGALEGANQDTVTASMNLILIQREAEMMQKALSVFHTEFNKIASEDLPRV